MAGGRMIVLGIDPGSQTTGWAIRDGNDCLGGGIITRHDSEPLTKYADRCARWLKNHATVRQEYDCVKLIAIEDVTAPNVYHQGRRQMIHPGSQIDTAKVAGYIAGYLHHGALSGIVWVPPAGNGSRPLNTYPPALVGPRERSGTGQLRHARSAWDIAGAAITITPRKATP